MMLSWWWGEGEREGALYIKYHHHHYHHKLHYNCFVIIWLKVGSDLTSSRGCRRQPFSEYMKCFSHYKHKRSVHIAIANILYKNTKIRSRMPSKLIIALLYRQISHYEHLISVHEYVKVYHLTLSPKRRNALKIYYYIFILTIFYRV